MDLRIVVMLRDEWHHLGTKQWYNQTRATNREPRVARTTKLYDRTNDAIGLDRADYDLGVLTFGKWRDVITGSAPL